MVFCEICGKNAKVKSPQAAWQKGWRAFCAESSHAGGHWFESSSLHQKETTCICKSFLFGVNAAQSAAKDSKSWEWSTLPSQTHPMRTGV